MAGKLTAAQELHVQKVLQSAVDAVDRIPNAALAKLAPSLVRAQKQVQKELKQWSMAQKGDDRYTPHKWRSALAQIEGAMQAIEAIGSDMADALTQAGRAAGKLSLDSLSTQLASFDAIFEGAMVPIDWDQAATFSEGEKLLLKRYPGSAARYAGEIRQEVQAVLAMSALRQQSIDEATEAMLKAIPSIFDGARWKAERLVRTETMHSYNSFHQAGLHELHEIDNEIQQRWDSTFDVRRCGECASLDGKVIDVGTDFESKWETATGKKHGRTHEKPPAHPNCRCILMAWRADWPELTDLPEVTDEEIEQFRKEDAERRRMEERRAKKAAELEAKKAADRKQRQPLPAKKSKPRMDGTKLAQHLRGVPSNEVILGMLDEAASRNEIAKIFSERDRNGKKVRAELRKLPVNEYGMKPNDKGIKSYEVSDSLGGAGGMLRRRMGGKPGSVMELMTQHHEGAAGFLEQVATGGVVSAEQLTGMNVLMHEQMHAVGRWVRGGYVRGGAVVDEVATELAARGVIRGKWGHIPIDHVTPRGAIRRTTIAEAIGVGRGYGYQGNVRAMHRLFQEEFGGDASRVLEQSVLNLKRKGGKPIDDPEEAVSAFVDCIPGLPKEKAPMWRQIISDMRITAGSKK